MLHLLLILLALILLGLATANVPSRWSLVAAGLFCWCLADHLAVLHA